jgi:hypothetical protein
MIKFYILAPIEVNPDNMHALESFEAKCKINKFIIFQVISLKKNNNVRPT